MLAWIPVIIIMVFFGGCATVITASSYQLIKSITRTPRERGPLARTIEV
jgi:hypothetical protein